MSSKASFTRQRFAPWLNLFKIYSNCLSCGFWNNWSSGEALSALLFCRWCENTHNVSECAHVPKHPNLLLERIGWSKYREALRPKEQRRLLGLCHADAARQVSFTQRWLNLSCLNIAPLGRLSFSRFEYIKVWTWAYNNIRMKRDKTLMFGKDYWKSCETDVLSSDHDRYCLLKIRTEGCWNFEKLLFTKLCDRWRWMSIQK